MSLFQDRNSGTLQLTKSEASQIGKKSSGWKHIEEERIAGGAYDDITKNQFAAAFDPAGTNYRDAASIQNLITDCAKTGVIDPNPAKNMVYMKVTDTKAIGVAVSKNGYIITAFPESVSKLPFLL